MIEKWKRELEEEIDNTTHTSQVAPLVSDSLSELEELINDRHLQKGSFLNNKYES